MGVLQDAINDNIREPVAPEADVPLSFYLPARVGLTARTTGDPLSIAGAVRREARAIDENIALTPPVALDTAVYEGFYSQPGFVLIVLGMFAVTGLLLVAVGIYGVLAYTVSQQTRDIAIRLAVGGEQGDILRLVLTRGLRLVGVGVGPRAALESRDQPAAREPAVAHLATRSRCAVDRRRAHRACRRASPAWCRRCGRCASSPWRPSGKSDLGTVPKAQGVF